MVRAAELQLVSPAISLWHAYDPAVKAELFSTALRLDDRLFLVDPIPLPGPAWDELTRDASVCGIFVTNANHERAVQEVAAKSGATILAAPAAASALWNLEAVCVEAGDQVDERLRVIEIEGAVEGEIALYSSDDGGALILGDALINFGSEGFALLPPKYCADQEQMRRSLRQMLDFTFERLLFAHGPPIVGGARTKLEQLLR